MSIDIYPTLEKLEETKMVIVDVRTEPEWRQTGVIKGCHCITFFDAAGRYDAEAFLLALDALGGKETEIVLICRTGARAAQIAAFLHQHGYNVKNIAGGVTRLTQLGYRLTPYTA